MSKKNVRRVFAVILAFTMMWGMCIGASAATYGSASSCEDAMAELSGWAQSGALNCSMTDLSDVDDINTLPAGRWVDSSNEDLWDAAYDANITYGEYVCSCASDGVWGDECKGLYTAWANAANAFEAVVLVSDGSNYVEYDGSCEDSSVSGNEIPKVKSEKKDKEEVVIEKTVDNDMGMFMDVSKNDINAALNALNQAIAAGDTQAAQNIRTTGITVNTGVWHSFNVGVYEQIENAGIPVTLNFIYKGVRYSVTIPAGAKVTELCDENGWCGFLNLAAHYGFEVL